MAAVTTVAAAALVTSAVAGVASTGYSVYQGRKMQKEAKKEERLQRAEIVKQKEEAQIEKKGLIDQQRYQMGLDSSYDTSSTTPTGMTVGRDSTLG